MGKLVTYTLRIPSQNQNEYPETHLFQTFIADNGSTVYAVDSVLTDKDSGNKKFKELTTGRKAEKQIMELNLSNEEICDYLLNSMDQSANLLSNSQQWEGAKAYNDNLSRILTTFQQMAG
jgi:hypothetical protein